MARFTRTFCSLLFEEVAIALEVIEELVDLAKRFQKDKQRGTELDLSPAEIAFYDALATSVSARELLGEPVLLAMARELAKTIRENATIDWHLRETVRAKLRVMVRRLLKKYKYPPDAQESATATVLAQAEQLAEEWAA